MEGVRQYLETVDNARAGEAEVAVAVECIDPPFAHSRECRPAVQLPEARRLACGALSVEPARHQRDNLWLRSPHRLPWQLPRRLARTNQPAVVATRDAHHLRDPMPSG